MAFHEYAVLTLFDSSDWLGGRCRSKSETATLDDFSRSGLGMVECSALTKLTPSFIEMKYQNLPSKTRESDLENNIMSTQRADWLTNEIQRTLQH